jgi:hypothetical protein
MSVPLLGSVLHVCATGGSASCAAVWLCVGPNPIWPGSLGRQATWERRFEGSRRQEASEVLTEAVPRPREKNQSGSWHRKRLRPRRTRGSPALTRRVPLQGPVGSSRKRAYPGAGGSTSRSCSQRSAVLETDFSKQVAGCAIEPTCGCLWSRRYGGHVWYL